MLNKIIESKILLAELNELLLYFSELDRISLDALLKIKYSFICISNFADFESTVKGTYKEFSVPSSQYNIKDVEFYKYLRNKFSGHIQADLLDKSIEWHPFLWGIKNESIDNHRYGAFANLLVLETAINTYVGENGSSKIFNTETDLNFQSDLNRFMDHLKETIQGAITYLQSWLGYWQLQIPSVTDNDMLKYSIDAGRTEFKYLRKK